jgi:hypothetical protein
MPGQIPLDTKYYPSDFQVVTMSLSGVSPTSAIVMYADRDLVIDSVIVTIGDGTNSTGTIRLAYVTDLAAPTYTANNSTGTTFNITTVINVTANTPASGGPSLRYITGDGTFDFVKSAGVPIQNIVPQGATIWVAANTLAGIERGSVQIRFRSQL